MRRTTDLSFALVLTTAVAVALFVLWSAREPQASLDELGLGPARARAAAEVPAAHMSNVSAPRIDATPSGFARLESPLAAEQRTAVARVVETEAESIEVELSGRALPFPGDSSPPRVWLGPADELGLGWERATCRALAGAGGEFVLRPRVTRMGPWLLHAQGAGPLQALCWIVLSPRVAHARAPELTFPELSQIDCIAFGEDGSEMSAPWHADLLLAPTESALDAFTSSLGPAPHRGHVQQMWMFRGRIDGAKRPRQPASIPAMRGIVRFTHLLGAHEERFVAEAGASRRIAWEDPGPAPESALRIDLSLEPAALFVPEAPIAAVVRDPSGRERAPSLPITGPGEMLFCGLPRGTYELVVEDPRFARVRRSGLALGTATAITLQGSALLTLEVVDRETQQSIPDFSATLACDRRNERHQAASGMRLGAEPDGSVRTVTPIFEGNYSGFVSAPGYVGSPFDARAIAAGERRVVRLALQRCGELGGLVIDAHSRAPLAGAEVRLRGFHLFPESKTPEHRLTHTGADGRFHFSDLQLFEGEVEARLDPGAYGEPRAVRLQLGERLLDLSLEATKPATLRGVLEMPLGFPLDRCVVSAESVDTSRNARRARAPVSAEGRFELGPLGPGETHISLRMPDVRIEHPDVRDELEGGESPLGVVNMRPGVDEECSATYSSLGTAFLRVQVQTDGVPAPGCVVECEGRDERGRAQRRYGVTDRLGSAWIAMPAVGRGAALRVLASDGSWTHEVATEVVGASGAVNEASIDVDLVAGVFKPVDRTTRLFLPQRSIYKIVQFASLELRSEFRTDEAGRMRALLPEGIHLFEIEPVSPAGPQAGPSRAYLDWSRAGVRPVNRSRK
ncbi:MAG: hypothetical protein JNJ88_03465 [Planctomycetes bacterium]|nr:hypothetical protein [Planctomycetota bacterium]